MPKRDRPATPGISVYPRGRTWSYRLDLGEDPLTGKRQRENKGGFDSEDAAWDAATESKQRHDQGRPLTPSRRTLDEFLTEWLEAVRYALKSSTHQNYLDYTRAYVVPLIGQRQLQGEVTVQRLNLFYRYLLEGGRRKPNNNQVMYEYWHPRRGQRDGLGPGPTEMAKACGVSIHASRAASVRFRRGRVPAANSAGLAPKTVNNVHRMLHRALRDAVAWGYVSFNAAEHASLPRAGRKRRNRPKPWSVDELASWLTVALADRYAGLWVLAATTGMRRSELAGITREGLDLWAVCGDCRAGLAIQEPNCPTCPTSALELQGTVTVDDTRVVVGGRAEDSDGKSEDSERRLSLDSFTVSALLPYLAMLDDERAAFGSAYPTHGTLMCFADGTRLHPDTITRRFNRLVDAAGVRRIRLHDIRHTWATLARDAGIDGKIVSDRLGHSDESVTQQIYTHWSTGFDRPAAELIASLIKDALEVRSTEIPGQGR